MALAAGILVKEIKAINDHSVANSLYHQTLGVLALGFLEEVEVEVDEKVDEEVVWLRFLSSTFTTSMCSCCSFKLLCSSFWFF